MIRFEQTSVITEQYSVAQLVGCSVMSATQSRFGASAVDTLFTNSSNTGGPCSLLSLPRERRKDERILARQHSSHAATRIIRCLAFRASSAGKRYLIWPGFNP